LAAKRVAPGHVTGLDRNAGMLTVARQVSNDGAPIKWTQGSALDLPFPSNHFNVVLCQQGLQFFPDQPRALREMRRVLRGSGRAALSVYSPIERTPGANAFVQALDEVFGTDASRIKRGEHSFANPTQLEDYDLIGSHNARRRQVHVPAGSICCRRTKLRLTMSVVGPPLTCRRPDQAGELFGG
jgi:SAM-dependent methyltransferase